MIRQYELVETVRAYDPEMDEALLNRAYVFAMQAHGSQTRASGDPYFSHPLEVAGILTSLKLDSSTIATALLHDVVEDTVATTEEIENLFGEKVGKLVDGVTKLSKLDFQGESDRQAENFRKFLLAMSDDIRVLLVKLADRLHNMRTLNFIKREEKRRRIARETLDIYAPLAERIGMHDWKDELEQIAFEHLEPEAMETITSRLHYLIDQNPTLERDMVELLKSELRAQNIEATISGRIKQPYSIWRKLERTNHSFEQLSDVMAFRIVTDDCYQALGVVHGAYAMVPGRFKDYISTPKNNGYRSIHTTVMGPHKRRLEIQIRTQRMHEEAENGLAAHWKYKQGNDRHDGRQYRFVRELLEILEHGGAPEEFLEHTRLAMYQDKVFCFTPKGMLVQLPRGASPVDFAYAVHTEVGDHCVGAKVNGRMVPLRHVLDNGDQVQILTSKDQVPSPRWENFVITGKARSAIRRHVRQKQDSEYRTLGETMMERACRRNGLDFSPVPMNEASKTLEVEGVDELYRSVGQGMLTEEDVLRAAYPGFKEDKKSSQLPRVLSDWNEESDTAIPIFGLGLETTVQLAPCCYPVPGDRIVGIKTKNQGIMIHRVDCSRLDEYDDKPDLWVDPRWHDRRPNEDNVFFVGGISIDAINEIGTLAAITSIVARCGGNIANVELKSRDSEFAIMHIDVEVRDLAHLEEIMRSLRASRSVAEIERRVS